MRAKPLDGLADKTALSTLYAARGARWPGAWTRTAAALLIAATALVAGCKRDTTGQLPTVSGEAIQAKREAVKGFALIAAYPDQKRGDELAIALEFSQPLVGTQSFDELLAVTDKNGAAVQGGWVLDDGGKILRFPHVEASKDYTVTIKAGLTAAAGDRIGQPISKQVYTGPLDPVVGFASQGSVLPARDSRGLPVVSINVPEVDVEFLRVKEKELPKFFSEYQRGGRKGSWELERDWDDKKPLSKLAEPVYVNRFVLGGKPNERVLTYLPLQDIKELQEPGLYFAVMKRAGQFKDEFETAFFTVSDLGLHARAYKDKLFVHVASLEKGGAVGGVTLKVIDAQGEPVLKGETDGNGNAMLGYKLDAGHVLIASKGSDVSMLPFNQPALDLSEFAVAGREQAWFDVFAWSGRDLYRPGETVRLSALLRDQDGKPIDAKGKALQPVFLRYVQPDGKTFLETRLQPDAQGYVRHSQLIPADAATGRWRVEFRTDPSSKEAVQGMTLRIEEFLPERLKMDLSAQPVLKPGQPFKLGVDAAYLYGAPAAGNRFTAKMTVAVEQHPLEQLPGYFFGDPTLTLPKEAKDVIDTTLDEQGKLTQDIALPDEAKPVSTIAAIVTGSVYETGGRSVNRSVKRVLWPADALVGVRPLFDDKDGTDSNGNAGFEITRVGSDGKTRPATGLRVTLVREHRDYHWNYADDGGWDYDFTRRYQDVEVRNVDVGASVAKLSFPVEWGEYRLDVFDPATKLTTRYPFRAGWSWDDQNRGLDARPDKVKLALDKTSYKAGDTLEVAITPPHEGPGLLMVEADRMLYVQAIEAKAGSKFKIPVTADWERHDIYVTALVFRGGSAPSKITPARAVGVVHVPMDRRDRKIAVGINVPKLMKPEQDLPVIVSAPQLAGKDAYVTVSAVDVGILNITRFPVPDAAAHFFAQRRLGVDAYDVYGRVIESYEGDTAKIRFGGDMALEALPQARRPTARVQTVDLFAGPVKLDAQGIARIKLAVPDFNGTVRVSALVYSGGSYGNKDAETVVRAPVLAEASTPRVLAPGDKSNVTLDVQNFTGKPGEFAVKVEGIGPLSLSDGEHKLSLGVEAKKTLTFPVVAREGYTTAQVRVRVDGNGYKVDRRYDLPVRPAWPSVLRSRTRVLDEIGAVQLGTDFADGLMPDSVNARMVVSALPPIPFASALQGALEYPYGCAEQTTSKGYAALELDEATAKMLGVKGIDAKQRRARMEGAFGRLAAMQIASGHFSMWGDGDTVNPALTPYVVEFLLDARDGGFAVPEAMLQKALKVLSEDLLSGNASFYGYDRREHLKFAYQAHAGYVLARVNRAPLGTLRALYDNDRKQSLTGLPLVHLGLALSLQGDKARGGKAIKEGFARDPAQRPPYLGDYGSRLRDDALMIALVHEHKLSQPEYDARTVSMGRDLDARRNSGWLYLSTQEQVALARLGKALMAEQGKQISGRWTVAGASTDADPAKLIGRVFDYATLASGVSFAPSGQPPLYASFEVAGVPRTAPAADDSQIEVARKYYTTEGKDWSGGSLVEGEALIVQVKIKAHSAMPDALLTDLLPAGLEIENFNLGDGKQWAGVVVDGIEVSERSSAADVKHEEFRDDRYIAALKLDANQTARVFYLVRAVTPGTYTVPPSLVEDMYRPELRGVGKASPASLSVRQP
ncbi:MULTISPECIES: alpha-2-macroglobulin family protein [Lysobacter]|uniref:alpha-2-macroglobulin family protein n=1 Tax=Lysobacter TaxID=68 RepID=UPI001F3E11AB|nr:MULTISPECIES: alpha-2-macroglobulin [Lysobacter]UJB21282.1 alpha-2-macroglobulin family protein [Lysobacter capsici]UJQ29602.1 alpha-2-macroglobulin family protein [Lysobacter gummosus]